MFECLDAWMFVPVDSRPKTNLQTSLKAYLHDLNYENMVLESGNSTSLCNNGATFSLWSIWIFDTLFYITPQLSRYLCLRIYCVLSKITFKILLEEHIWD
jgi:hypothetical protein